MIPAPSSFPLASFRTNMIRFDGCANLCGSLKYDVNRVLVYLDLSECSIGVQGAKAVGDMLKENESLLEIRLKHNHIGHEGTVRTSCPRKTLVTQRFLSCQASPSLFSITVTHSIIP